MLLRALPVNVEITGEGVRLKRGISEVAITGEKAVEMVRIVLSLAAKQITREAILRHFDVPARESVEHLIDGLLLRRFLVTSDGSDEQGESNLDIFYWQFEKQSGELREKLNQTKLTILGVNSISRQLVASLLASNWCNFEVIDYLPLRNPAFFKQGEVLAHESWPFPNGPLKMHDTWMETLVSGVSQCIVATSDVGNFQAIAEWNGEAIETKTHFLPVALERMIGYVGPLVIPGETACFACFRLRRQAHDSQALANESNEIGSGYPTVGFHPTMASMLGNIAAFELTKFYSETIPISQVGTIIELNMLTSQMTGHKVLKVPRCPTCSPFNRRSSTNVNDVRLRTCHDDTQSR